MNRRDFLASLISTPLVTHWPFSDHALRSVELKGDIPVAGSHGDTWEPAWAEDGKLYSPSNDTHGMNKAADANVAFNRFAGAVAIPHTGITVNPMRDYGRLGEKGTDGCTWKSSGCAYIDGALYLVVARHKYGEESGDPFRRQTAANASIIRSTDFGRTWVRSAKENMEQPLFPGRRFATPYFIQYGLNVVKEDAADQFVYAVSNNGFWDNGDDMILGRIARAKLSVLRGEDWEYYTGGNGMHHSAWAPKAEEAKLILDSQGKLGKFGMTGAVYVPSRRRYLMVAWYYPAGGGKMKGAATETAWNFYEAPHPWGPWSAIGSKRFSPEGYYCPQICPKFLTADRAYIWTAGNWNDPRAYKLHIVPATLL
jgi:hypothetical protein